MVGSPELLAEAFSEFISASTRLEISYRELQGEVHQLGRELAERNAALSASVAENRSMRESLEHILEALPCGVLVCEEAGTIRLANPEAARLLALPVDEMTSLEQVRVERGIDLSFGLQFAPQEVGEETAEQELAVRGTTGERWLAAKRRSLGEAAPAGRRSSVLILRDVSARRRMEAERDAARSAVALAEVSAILAHEIRNPLASMELFAGLIADCPERSGDWVVHLRAGIRALSGTVNNVLTLHGATPPAMEHFALRRELELASEFLRPQAEQAEVSLELDGGSGEGLWIRANRSALHQILLNLGTNALRHTPAGGSVRISAARGKLGVEIKVWDTGAGIPVEFLPKLFHDRFSGSGSTSGLGLAVCGRLMRQHGGSIHVESQPGVGSTFTLEFPSR